MFRPKKGGKNVANEKETQAVEELLSGIGMPEKNFGLRIYKMGPVTWRGRQCAGVGGQQIKTYEEDSLPDWVGIQDEIAAEWGGGKYMLRAVDGNGRYLKGGGRRFTISTDEYPPKLNDETLEGGRGGLIEPWRRHGVEQENDVRRELKELKETIRGDGGKGIEAMIAAMQMTSQQSIESQKMTMLQSSEGFAG